MDGSANDSEGAGAGADETRAVDEAQALLDAGNVDAALAVITDALAVGGPRAALLALAASAWVAAVDQGSPLAGWEPARRDRLLRWLVTQDGCDAGPPVLHQRIAAQHSGGVAGHLSREAQALGPLLADLLGEATPHPRAVLLALLLRDTMDGIDQDRLSDWHRRLFSTFSLDDLDIPYSVIFERRYFRRNVADLADYVRERGTMLLDGSLPLPHLLLLYWLVPQSFADLPRDWHERAIRNRLGDAPPPEEAAAARSLRLRFGDGLSGRDEPDLARCAEGLAELRRVLHAESGSGDEAAVTRLTQRPRQLAAAALNEARARFPGIVRSRRRLRVAVCVSGQLRGFRRAWATWRPLLADVDATIFVDSWSKVGRGTPEPFRSVLPFEGAEFCATYKRVGAEIGLDELRARYPRLFVDLEQTGVVTEDDLAALYRTPHVRLDDDADAAFASFTNSEKMYYKVQRCFEMMQATGETFDLVVRLRPDKPIRLVAFDWQDMFAALRARPALYCETAFGVHYGAILMGDQVAIGLPQAARVYAETFSRAPPIAALSPYRMEPHLWGHTSVAQSCWFAGLEVRKVPIKFGAFMEAEPLGAAAIGHRLVEDSEGRMDAIDRQLISANRQDTKR